MKKKDLAVWLHRNYEDIASENDWDTQEECKTSFDELPEENRQTMLELAERLIEEFDITLSDDWMFQRMKRGDS